MKDYSSPTSTLDLTAAARAHPTLRRYHIGTYPLDALANLTVAGRPRHLIYNMSPSNRPPGTHWISIWLTRDLKAEVVDSLGRRPLSTEVLGFVRRHSASAVFCDQQIQDWTSNVCGLYCLSHGLARARGRSLESWLAQYTERLTDNDERVQCEFMRELAIPSLFTPSLKNWKQEIHRACRNISPTDTPKPKGWRQRSKRATAAEARAGKHTRTQCASSERTPSAPTTRLYSRRTWPIFPSRK